MLKKNVLYIKVLKCEKTESNFYQWTEQHRVGGIIRHCAAIALPVLVIFHAAYIQH